MKKTKDVALVLSSGGPGGFAYIAAIKEVVPDVNIEDLRIPYAVVATDLYTGEEISDLGRKLMSEALDRYER